MNYIKKMSKPVLTSYSITSLMFAHGKSVEDLANAMGKDIATVKQVIAHGATEYWVNQILKAIQA